jgi:hypothetical protein
LDPLRASVQDEADAVSIGILQVHLAIPPALIRGLEIDPETFVAKLFVQSVKVVDDEIGHAPRDSVARK